VKDLIEFVRFIFPAIGVAILIVVVLAIPVTLIGNEVNMRNCKFVAEGMHKDYKYDLVSGCFLMKELK